MSIPKLPKKLRRIVSVPVQGSQRRDFDITFTRHGIEIRLAGTTNRKVLKKRWNEIIDGAMNERKGYRVYSVEEAIAQLEDVTDTLRELG